MLTMPELLSQPALRVLAAVCESDSDGYTLLSRSGLKLDDFIVAVQNLFELGLLKVRGELQPGRILEAYFQATREAARYRLLLSAKVA